MHLVNGVVCSIPPLKPAINELARCVPPTDKLRDPLDCLRFSQMRRQTELARASVAESQESDPVVGSQNCGRPEPQVSSQVSVGIAPSDTEKLKVSIESPVFATLAAMSEMTAVNV